jgi:hypothetical protein
LKDNSKMHDQYNSTNALGLRIWSGVGMKPYQKCRVPVLLRLCDGGISAYNGVVFVKLGETIHR